MSMHASPHPGGIVRRQCLEPLGLTVTRAAEGLGRLPAGALGVVERTHGGFGRDGDPAVEGLRLDARNLAEDADGLRPPAGPRPRRRDGGRALRGGLSEAIGRA